MKIFHNLVSSNEAVNLIAGEIRTHLKEREVEIGESLGYASSRDVFSKYDVPSFDRSEVDGYAVFHEDVEGAEEDSPKKLRLQSRVMAGDSSAPELIHGNCIYIATGAIIPRGCDAVVMIEDTRESEKYIEIYKSVYPGENISFAGTDISMGALVLPARVIITPERIGTLAASGISSVWVYEKINIGIFSTGNEIIQPGDSLVTGQIFDTNSPYFVSRLSHTGLASTTFLGIVKDDENEMKRLIESNVDKFDILMGSGSTSAGFYDVLYRIVEQVGGKIMFHGMNIKPGKPTFFGKIKNTLFIGMPGFPLSSAVILNYIVVPSLLQAMGSAERFTRKTTVPYRINAERSQETILPVISTRDNRCFPIMGNSGSISRILYADGLISIPSDVKYVEAGESVDYMPINEHVSSVISIGSNDPLLDTIILGVDRQAKIVNVGSWGGINAMKLGIPDISGIHILKDGKYNVSVMDEVLRKKCYLVRGFLRTRGFVSRFPVSGFSEITEKKLIFVNRNKGSGTRDLIEEMLGQDSEIRRNLIGYLWETNTEAGVARAISQGRADAGISLKYYAEKLGLEFNPIREEEFDILMSKKFYDSATGKEFLSNLKEIGRYISEFIGYQPVDDTGGIIKL
ncbi:MAG: molybdopterin biosynthesis protein [Thermoplasmatales archaeon]|nr:molybdopterin biosynthesis protein [Thermoplasmatales archaeon]MCW6170626.1 molybdopterin biosynthesis protein [Thermoplasmatales archaeon]